MADIFFNGQRLDNVTHIGYDPANPAGDRTTITVRKPSGDLFYINEAEKLTPPMMRYLNRKINKGKHIGKSNFWGRLRYRWAKCRGRVQGDFYVKANSHGEGIVEFLNRKKK